MKRLITTAATGALALGVFAAPANAANENANGGLSAAAKACVAQKKADKAAFAGLYGEHPMRECIKAAKAAQGEEEITVSEFKNAAEECRAERDADAAAFAETYGTNGNKRNALGKCVSSKVKEADTATS
jgi:hypothetical protein